MIDFKKYKCAIFDLDGTLLDSVWVWQKVDEDFLGRRNIAVTEEYIREIKSHDFLAGAKYTKEKYNLPESCEEIIDEWFSAVKNFYEHEIKLKPYAREYLDMVRAAGLELVIATSSDSALYLPCMKNNGIMDYFSDITESREAARGKKFPDVYILAAKKAGFKPSECIVYEDILSAIKAAKAGGFDVCGVYDEASSADWELIKEISDYSIESYENLLKNLY